MRQALAAADALGAGLAGLLDNDRIGVVQLDQGGRVLAANAPALEILRRGDGLSDRDGTLQAWLPADRGRLQRLLGRALPGLWGETPSGGSMTLQRPSGRLRLGLHVSPVGDGAADFGGRRVAALALVTCAGSSSRSTGSWACRGRWPWCGWFWPRTPCPGADAVPVGARSPPVAFVPSPFRARYLPILRIYRASDLSVL